MRSACAKTCSCNDGLGNTAVGCSTQMKVEKRPWLMNKFQADGVTLNFIDLTATLNDSYFSGLINNVDPFQRLYPLPEIKNITDIRDKPITYTWKDSTEVKVRDGIRKFEGMFPPDSASPQLNGILDRQVCTKPCKFSVDANGTIWGKISSDGTKLYPIEMDPQSVAAIFVKPTDTEPTMLGYSFNYAPGEKDCELRGLEASELVGGINPLEYDGLFDVYLKVISCTTIELVAKLYTIFGELTAPLVDKGLVVGDFALFNVSTSSAILLTGTGASFSESPSGTYNITYKTADDPASTNHLRLTPTKNGRDYSAVIATSIVVA